MEKPQVSSPSNALGPLDKLRVLVVEDEVLISMLLADALDELGCELIGPCDTLSAALVAAEGGGYDVAVVDFNLEGEQATPLTRRLAELGHPFAIASGGGTDATGHGEAAHLPKPFRIEDVKSVLRVLGGRAETRN
ncbi:hypothetical protein A9995_00010 [Erythrobacter sp. QSSC1-22B]|uniref:response regulator n=1 Tax=Erythrobacter sp. QSSC1-22B TaxID=1860125 RepID=UPI000805679D|nr:response regulator [Erythrobacter sp. QSSC1-22B]OBX20167.1 hypothetical protein A9995_00010 [Erythrobacter sp. QSSC1-22B]